MAIYTGVADANGDFTVPFSSSYTGGEKITVTAEKDGAIKSIEIHAPSEPVLPVVDGVISFDGFADDFPNNIGTMKISGVTTALVSSLFYASSTSSIFKKIKGLIINDGVTSIENNCFDSWTALTFFEMPDSVLSIGQYCFNNCRSLVTLKLSKKLTSIPTYSFFQCNELIELEIPDLVENIGTNAFVGCGKLKKLTFGSALTRISAGAFSGASSLDEMILKTVVPPVISSTTFVNLAANCVIKVPLGSLSAYQTADTWSSHADKIIEY